MVLNLWPYSFCDATVSELQYQPGLYTEFGWAQFDEQFQSATVSNLLQSPCFGCSNIGPFRDLGPLCPFGAVTSAMQRESGQEVRGAARGESSARR
jgi:hypothetical protein